MHLARHEIERLYGIGQTTVSHWVRNEKIKRLKDGKYPAHYLANLVPLPKGMVSGGKDLEEEIEVWVGRGVCRMPETTKVLKYPQGAHTKERAPWEKLSTLGSRRGRLWRCMLMKSNEVIGKFRAAGVELFLEPDSGRLKLRAPRKSFTSDMRFELREHKSEIIEALKTEPPDSIQRWGLPPSCELPLADAPPCLEGSDRGLVIAHMGRQPPDAIRWVLDRANEYADILGWQADSCDLAACLDAIKCQRQTDDVNEILELMRDIEAMADQWGD